MKSITTGRNRFVLVAIGLTLVVLAYAGAQSSSAGQDSPGGSSGEAQKRQEAEAAVVRTGAVNEMEAALGDAFGGAWFDESAPLLRIGVVSSEGRSIVEAVAARFGLASIVVPTPVRSTRPELFTAQEELNRQLADLFANGEVGTLLQPQHNSVLVQLGSGVPAERRAELNRDVALTGVDVAIATMDRPQLGPRPEARCNEWKQHNAFCNKPIVAGVTIEAKKGCSAGPAIRATDPKLPTSTFILTAGHCIVNGGGYDEKWFAFDKSAHKTEIGKAIQYLVSEKGDVGVVTVAPGSYWSEKGSVPVEPTIAPFAAGKKEPEPFPVVGKNKPTVNMMSCRVGEASPLSCGKITGENGTFESLKGVTVKGLITVSGANSAVGDSGGPWFAKAQYEEVPSKGWVDGTHV
ncbi:MAG TPA: hypothetical protein VFT10_06310, partial [Solirubrobacterales bacterium]|nr:hypothetical protein [Solirubrobacterales bacterium]